VANIVLFAVFYLLLMVQYPFTPYTLLKTLSTQIGYQQHTCEILKFGCCFKLDYTIELFFWKIQIYIVQWILLFHTLCTNYFS